MSFAVLFNLGGGEIILIMAFILILSGAKNLPELAEVLREGFEENHRGGRTTIRPH